MQPEPRLLTVMAAATALSVSEATVRRQIASGDLPSVRVRRRVLVPVSALDALDRTASRPSVGLTARERNELLTLGLKRRRKAS